MTEDKTTTVVEDKAELEAKLREEGLFSALSKAFEKMSRLTCQPGDILVFQFERKLPLDIRKRIIAGFHPVLQQHRLRGFFIPPDVNLLGAMAIEGEVADGTDTAARQTPEAGPAEVLHT